MPFNKTKQALLWLVGPFSPKQKHYWRVVLLCFFTAGTFWMLNALNKNYTTVITYPIQFAYDHQQLIPVKPLPEEVIISVTGRGWKLLRKSLRFQVKPAELTIRGLPYAKRLPGHALRPAISNVLDGLTLNFVVTDTLSFDFDRLTTRKIPLGIDTTLLVIEPGYVFAGPVQIRPDSVTFTGPELIIDEFPSPYLLSVPEQSLNAPFTGNAVLTHDYTTLVNADVTDAEVAFGVIPLERMEVTVQPILQNFPPGYLLRMVNGPIKIQYSFLPRHRALINPELFTVALDYLKFNAADSTIAPLVIQKSPLIKQMLILPKRVKVSLLPQ